MLGGSPFYKPCPWLSAAALKLKLLYFAGKALILMVRAEINSVCVCPLIAEPCIQTPVYFIKCLKACLTSCNYRLIRYDHSQKFRGIDPSYSLRRAR